MEKVKNGFRWVADNFFVISIAVFILADSTWFWLRRGVANSNLGYFLLLIYAIFAIFYWKMKPRSYFRTALLILTALSWLANISYTILSSPTVEDIAYHNRTAYILVANHNFMEQPYTWFTLAKWKWGHVPETKGIYVTGSLGHVNFVYDEETKVVGVVGFFGLAYTDGEPPRDYENGPEYKGYKYYSSRECIKLTGGSKYHCETYRYTIYKCNLQNTGCIQIPVEYIGTEWISDLTFNEGTRELGFSVERRGDHPADDMVILVYSYGPIPRCYVEGCEILDAP